MLFFILSTNHDVLNVFCLATGPKTPPNLHKAALFLRNEQTSRRARSSVLSAFVNGALHLSHSNVCSSPWGAVSWWAHRLNGSLAAACVCVCVCWCLLWGCWCFQTELLFATWYPLWSPSATQARAHTHTQTGTDPSQVTTTGRAPVDFRSSCGVVTITHNHGQLKAITLKYCGETAVVDKWSIRARRNIVSSWVE